MPTEFLTSSSPASNFAVMFSGPSCRHTFAGTESNHEECSLSGERHAEDNRSWHLEDGVSGSVRMGILQLKPQPAVTDLRFSYPDPGRPVVHRDSHKALRSSPSCHTTGVRHRR